MSRHHWGALSIAVLLLAGPAAACTGDCDGDGQVAINEAVRGVNIALGNAPLGECAQFDANGDGMVAVNELIAAVAAVLDGCPDVTPGPKPRATPAPDAPATLTVEEGAGHEIITGRAYGFGLADFRGNRQFALYEGLRDDNHPETLGDLRLTQTLLYADGEPVLDAMNRRLIVSMHFRHVPLQVGTFHCAEGLPATPGSLLTFDVNVSARDDERLMLTSVDQYFGYPRVIDAIDCTLAVASLDDGTFTATFEAHMLNSDADDLAHVTGRLRVPAPTCTYAELQASPMTCYPWAF